MTISMAEHNNHFQPTSYKRTDQTPITELPNTTTRPGIESMLMPLFQYRTSACPSAEATRNTNHDEKLDIEPSAPGGLASTGVCGNEAKSAQYAQAERPFDTTVELSGWAAVEPQIFCREIREVPGKSTTEQGEHHVTSANQITAAPILSGPQTNNGSISTPTHTPLGLGLRVNDDIFSTQSHNDHSKTEGSDAGTSVPSKANEDASSRNQGKGWKARSGIDLSGQINWDLAQIHFIDFHKFVSDTPPFLPIRNDFGSEVPGIAATKSPNSTLPSIGANIQVFNNPWHWVAVLGLYEGNPFWNTTKPYIWNPPQLGSSIFVSCATIVWDVAYDVVAGEVVNLNLNISNSSATGIVSMSQLPPWGVFSGSWGNAVLRMSQISTSVEDMSNFFALEASRLYVSSFAGQSSPRLAVRAQARDLILVTKVSKAALWTLVTSNLFYALIGIILTVFALLTTSNNVRQVQTRLSIPGLVSKLFEKPYSERSVRDNRTLFRESSGLSTSRISV
ncbi:hypothetical protein AOQ84DRAFT_392979 [Glonium stellatum]|uniref:Transmembrane protein n=1 Tax=Glonium stellatum TaxID=574774 RepID=A0A8E2EPA8_9PEZI|nr:hypothetical protein AOQ84DRAFT_392979 [Glonium stellatum]